MLTKKFINFSIYKKMRIIYSVLFFSLLIVSSTAMQITLNIYDAKLYNMSVKELRYFANTINVELKNVEQLSYDIALDYDIQKQLNDIMTIKHKKDYLFYMSEFRNRMIKESLNADSISSIIYTDGKNVKYQIGKEYIDIPEDIYNEIIHKSHSAKGAYVHIDPSQRFPYLISARDIRYYINVNLNYLGTLILVNDINDIIKPNEDALGDSNTALFITSESEIIYSNNDELLEKLPEVEGDEGYKIININNKKYFMCFFESKINGWKYINMFPYGSIFIVSILSRYLMMAGFLVLFMIAFFILKKVARYFTRPIEDLTKSMQIVESGDFVKAKEYLGEDYSLDEIGILKKDFRLMLDKIVLLIRENYEKQLLIKDTHYKALQAQINPHFLYNILNSVNWMIRSSRNEEARKMVVSLGELLHAAFSKEHLTVVEEEVRLLNNYTYIQKIRYDERVEFILEISDVVMDCVIPKMTLQPIVENSINYGVDQSAKTCKIRVNIYQKENRLIIRITDDGPGMDKKHLEEVRRFKMKPKGNGIGLENIRERLRLLFDEDYKFEINSVLGEGTEVKIEVPCNRREAHV